MSNTIDADLRSFKQLEGFIRDSGSITGLSEKEIHDHLHYCIEALNRFAMGGRSTCLIGLSLLLWKGNQSYIKSSEINIEKLLPLSFRITTDPSFIFPEWGVVLTGVIIAKYRYCFPEKSLEVVENQCKLLLRHLTSRLDLSDAIRVTAESLLTSWKNDFYEGLEPLVRTALLAWPDTSNCEKVTVEELEKSLSKLFKKKLATDLNLNERRAYKLLLENKGKWDSIKSIDWGISE